MNAQKLLDDLIQMAASDQEAKEKECQAAYDVKYQRLLEQLKREIGGEGMWELLQPYAKIEASKHQRNVQIAMSVEASELHLAPFTISNMGDGGGWMYYDISDRAYNSFQDLLLKCRTMYPEWVAAYRGRQVKQLMGGLDYWSKRDRTPEEAEAVCQELIQICPEEEGNWRNLLAVFLKNKRDVELQAEVQQKKAEDTEQGKQEYEAAFRDYCERWKEALDYNQQQLGELQGKVDTIHSFWKLTYGIVAADDEEGKFLETRFVYVTSNIPQADHTYWVVKQGKYAEVMYYFPVSAQAIDVQPSTDVCDICKQIAVPQAIGRLVVLPGELAYAEAMAQLGLIEFEELPERPAVPSTLDDYDALRIREHVRDETAGLESLAW